MTRLITRGFESGVIADEFDSSNGVTMESSVVRTGARSFRMGAQNNFGLWNFDVPTDNLYVGSGYRLNNIAQDNNQSFFEARSPDSEISLRQFTDGSIHVMRGGTDIDESSSGVLIANTWQFVEMWVFMANASGRVQVKVDGDLVIDFTGDTLENSDADMNDFRLNGHFARTVYFDDLVINDDAGGVNNTFPGIISLVPLFPTAAGFATELQRGGSDSGANWDQCDEVPADAVSYVFDTVVDDRDLFNIADLTLPAGATIKNVIVQARCEIDSGSGNIAVMVRSGSTEDQSADQVLAPGWKLFQHLMDVNPDDSLAWEDADVDALQIGIKVR